MFDVVVAWYCVATIGASIATLTPTDTLPVTITLAGTRLANTWAFNLRPRTTAKLESSTTTAAAAASDNGQDRPACKERQGKLMLHYERRSQTSSPQGFLGSWRSTAAIKAA
jgi:hypothetical protein